MKSETTPSVTGSRESFRQAEFCGRVVHSVNQFVAGRAKHPHHRRPLVVALASSFAQTGECRFVSNFQDASLPARFARSRCVRIPEVESPKSAIGAEFLPCPSAVNYRRCGTPQIEGARTLSNASAPTLRGADALRVLPRSFREASAALTTDATVSSFTSPRLQEGSFALSVAILSRQMLRGHFRLTVSAFE